MPRTVVAFAGGMRLSDHLNVGVSARGGARGLTLEVVVCYVNAVAPFRTISAREMLDF